MKRIKERNIIKVKKNDYIQFVNNLNNLEGDFNLIDPAVAKSIKDVNYIMLSLGYPPNGWSEDVDVFKFLTAEILLLLQSEKLIFILDGTFEGYGYNSYPIRKSLENAALKNNINPKLIFFFTGNFKDFSDKINVIPIYNLDNELVKVAKKKTVDQIKETISTTISDKIFLSLSRRNRYYRVLANFIMYNSEIYPYGLISQNTISNFFVNNRTLAKIQKTSDNMDCFKKSLPWIADYNNFEDNKPMDPLYELHLKTPFSLVNETLVSSENNTSFFYSEKILKPIMALQPMIIYGQPGINKNLTMMGYVDYSCYFDLSFDDEEDDVIRFQKLLKSITPLVQSISSMNLQDRVRWRFKHQDMLLHNYDVFLKRKNTVEQINKFALIVEKLKI
jgi:hypothetical protein